MSRAEDPTAPDEDASRRARRPSRFAGWAGAVAMLLATAGHGGCFAEMDPSPYHDAGTVGPDASAPPPPPPPPPPADGGAGDGAGDGGVPDGGIPDGGVPDGGIPDGGVPDGGNGDDCPGNSGRRRDAGCPGNSGR